MSSTGGERADNNPRTLEMSAPVEVNRMTRCSSVPVDALSLTAIRAKNQPVSSASEHERAQCSPSVLRGARYYYTIRYDLLLYFVEELVRIL